MFSLFSAKFEFSELSTVTGAQIPFLSYPDFIDFVNVVISFIDVVVNVVVDVVVYCGVKKCEISSAEFS